MEAAIHDNKASIEDQQLYRLEHSLIELRGVFRKHQTFIKHKYKVSALEMEIVQFVK